MNRNLTYVEMKRLKAQEVREKELRVWILTLLFIGLVVLPILVGDPS